MVLSLVACLVAYLPGRQEAFESGLRVRTQGEATSRAGEDQEGEVDPKALSEYNGRRQQVRRTAGSHLALARWCQEHGLRAEAMVHAIQALDLDPRKEDAWRLLGFRKVEGRWLSPEQARDEVDQKEADREWAPKLSAWHRALHGPPKKTRAAADQQARKAVEAREALAGIEAPRAVPTIYREFARGGPADQELAVQILGQIPGPAASKALATLAIYGRSPEVRRKATETLRWREPLDYVEALVGLLATPLKYEVRPDTTGAGGIGSPGVLVIEGERQEVWRTYVGVDAFEAAHPPDLTIRTGDYITYDAAGEPVIRRRTGQTVSPRQIAQEYANAALAARARMEQDIAEIKAENAARHAFNEIVFRVLKDATGQGVTDTSQAWKDWLADRENRPREEPVKPYKPLYVQNIKPYAVAWPGQGSMAFLERTYETPPFL